MGSQSHSVRSEKSDLTYKKLPDSVLFWTALSVHLTIILFSILIKDVAMVFEFSGTCGYSLLTYFFPAIGYQMAKFRFGTTETNK